MRTLRATAIRNDEDGLSVLDQESLPREERWIRVRHPQQMIEAIRSLKVRGAPLIGVAAALALARAAEEDAGAASLRSQARALREARPTAVNLMHAIDRMLAALSRAEAEGGSPREALANEAGLIFDEDVALCARMAENGEPLLADGDGVLTHCNTGGLATAGAGTALAVIRRAHERGKRIHVYVDETRPLLQGARLTCWELARLGIPHTLICDNMAASLMRQGRIRKVFVGADRIAANGDFANKIGTYAVAALASHHGIAFHPVAPRTTVDLACASGKDIPIEERAPDEVRGGWAPLGTPVCNPAFDVTPAELVTALVLDTRVYRGDELMRGALARELRGEMERKWQTQKH